MEVLKILDKPDTIDWEYDGEADPQSARDSTADADPIRYAQ